MWLVPPELKFLYFLCQIISNLTTYLTTYPVVNHRPGGCELFLLLKTKYPDGNHVTDSSKLPNTLRFEKYSSVSFWKFFHFVLYVTKNEMLRIKRPATDWTKFNLQPKIRSSLILPIIIENFYYWKIWLYCKPFLVT